MDPRIPKAISSFFEAVATLRELKVIRSDKFLGDIAEYMASHLYELDLAVSGRQPGHDGKDSDGALVQVKYHGSSTRTNIDLGDASVYDHVLVVLGPNSLLRNQEHKGDFLVYRMPSAAVRAFTQTGNGTFSCGKEPFRRPPDRVFNLSDISASASSS